MKKPFVQNIAELSCTAGHIAASAQVPADSVWYSGHFHGNPILPGIAILALVKEAILAAEHKENRKVEITGIGRVRFRLPVKPDDRMSLRISSENRQDRLSYEFSVSLSDELACTGFLRARITAG